MNTQMKGPASPALIKRNKRDTYTFTDNETPKISTQRQSRTSARAFKASQAEMVAIWDQIGNEYEYTLCQNPQKSKSHKEKYVLSATFSHTTKSKNRRRRGKSKRSKVLQSDKFGLLFSSFQEAQTVASRLKFGCDLHKHLQSQRKRYRPNVKTACSQDLESRTDREWYKSDIENKRQRLSRLALFHNIQPEMEDTTKGYTSFTCVKDWKRLDNFVRSLRRMQDARIKREKRTWKNVTPNTAS